MKSKPLFLKSQYKRQIVAWLRLSIVCCPLFLISCGGGGKSSKPDAPEPQPVPNPAETGLDIEFDPRFTPSQKDFILVALKNAKQIKLKLLGKMLEIHDKYFVHAFGPHHMNGVISFVNRTVNVALPHPSDTNTSSSVIAANIGLGLWFVNVAGFPDRATYEFGSEMRLVQHGQAGVVRFYPSFFKMPWFRAILTLVHEGFHSRCLGGIPQDMIDYVKNIITEKPRNHACGHPHQYCPKTHKYRNLAACDNRNWGSYGLSAFLALLLANACDNCTASQINQLHAYAADLFGRVYTSDFQRKPLPKAIIDMSAELPNMNHVEGMAQP